MPNTNKEAISRKLFEGKSNLTRALYQLGIAMSELDESSDKEFIRLTKLTTETQTIALKVALLVSDQVRAGKSEDEAIIWVTNNIGF